MADGGLDPEGLRRLREGMAGHVARGAVPGLVAAVARGPEVHVEVLGRQRLDDPAPMRRDTLFRITSMTKPVTAVAAMLLVEDGRVALDDPVDPFLPELADRRVLRRLDGPLDDTEPARRPITLRDLLTFRAGIGMILEPSSQWPIQQAIDGLQLMTGPPMPRTPHGADGWMARLGSLPLMHQPGERWMYGSASDIVGVLVTRASGQPFEQFLHERLFAPLGMADTDFQVPSGKRDRLAGCYRYDPAKGALVDQDPLGMSQWTRPPAFPAGKDGLVSTVDDYLAFGRMLLGGGRLGSVRILQPRTVAAMTTDQLTPAQKAASPFFPGFWEGRGWGLGLSVVTEGATRGRFGWDGGFGTSWQADPALDFTGVLMTQRLVYPEPAGIDRDFWTLAERTIRH